MSNAYSIAQRTPLHNSLFAGLALRRHHGPGRRPGIGQPRRP